MSPQMSPLCLPEVIFICIQSFQSSKILIRHKNRLIRSQPPGQNGLVIMGDSKEKLTYFTGVPTAPMLKLKL